MSRPLTYTLSLLLLAACAPDRYDGRGDGDDDHEDAASPLGAGSGGSNERSWAQRQRDALAGCLQTEDDGFSTTVTRFDDEGWPVERSWTSDGTLVGSSTITYDRHDGVVVSSLESAIHFGTSCSPEELTQNTYDAEGRILTSMTSVVDACGDAYDHWTTWEYEVRGRQVVWSRNTSSGRPEGVEYDHDACGLPAAMHFADGSEAPIENRYGSDCDLEWSNYDDQLYLTYEHDRMVRVEFPSLASSTTLRYSACQN